MKVAPTYSAERGRDRYHNNDKCTERNNIETYNLRQGTDGRQLCHHCAKLNAEGK
jgi:hypothetical protein